MDNFDALQHLWQQGAGQTPIPVKKLIRKIRKIKRRMLAAALGGLLSLLATLPVMAWVYLAHHPRYATTRLSIVLCMTAVAGAAFLQSHALRTLLMPVKDDLDNKAMLAALARMQVRQKKINTTFVSAYFILLSIAMALYIFEFAAGHFWFGVAAYGLTFGWIGVAWFYLRPKTVRKQNAALDTMIRQLKALQDGWNS